MGSNKVNSLSIKDSSPSEKYNRTGRKSSMTELNSGMTRCWQENITEAMGEMKS